MLKFKSLPIVFFALVVCGCTTEPGEGPVVQRAPTVTNSTAPGPAGGIGFAVIHTDLDKGSLQVLLNGVEVGQVTPRQDLDVLKYVHAGSNTLTLRWKQPT